MTESARERSHFPDDLDASFDRWVRETIRRRLEIAALVFVLVLAFGRVIGQLVLHGTPENAPGAFWMPVQIAIAAATGLAMRYLPVARTHPTAVAAGFFLAMPAAAAAHLSALGGFDGPYFYAAYLIAPMTTSLPFALRERILMTVAPPLAFVLTFVLAHPEHLPFRMIHIPAVSLVANIVISIVLGHAGYRLTRERHGLASELARHALDEARRVERQALARVLHDDFAQLGTAARIELKSIEHRAARGDVAAEDLAYLRQILEELDRSSRRIVTNLRETTDESLPSALERMCSLVERTGTVAIERSFEDVEIEPRTREVVFRAIQEALTNALKHASARRISVQVVRDGVRVLALVDDDGRGFDPAAASLGFGLVGMRERVDALDGTLRVESGASGTSVRVSIPAGGAARG